MRRDATRARKVEVEVEVPWTVASPPEINNAKFNSIIWTCKQNYSNEISLRNSEGQLKSTSQTGSASTLDHNTHSRVRFTRHHEFRDFSHSRPSSSYVPPSSPQLRLQTSHSNILCIDTPGPTSLSYTPNGRYLITAGSNNAIRVYSTGSDGEPKTLDEALESNAAVVAGQDFFITGGEDGTVWLWDLNKGEMETMLVRCALPVRDLALSRGGEWCCVASE